MTQKTKVLVIYGGKSTEHEVSCRSAAFIMNHLDRSKYEIEAIAVTKSGRWLKQSTPELLAALETDKAVPIHETGLRGTANHPLLLGQENKSVQDSPHVVFPIIHGTGGEDGTLQGLLDLTDVAYVGPDTLGSAVAMDKVVAKKLAETAGVRVVPYIDIKLQTWLSQETMVLLAAEEKLGYPMFVKPARLGSSVGVNKARNRDELLTHIKTAFEFDDKILIEKALRIREIECAVLGDYDPEVSVPGEVMPQVDFYTYDAKYLMDNGAAMKIPADLSPAQASEARQLAKKVFQALELYGMARVDLFLESSSGIFYLNEVNTIPGFTSISQYPLLWEASGVSKSAMLDRLIDLALRRQSIKRALRRTV